MLHPLLLFKGILLDFGTVRAALLMGMEGTFVSGNYKRSKDKSYESTKLSGQLRCHHKQQQQHCVERPH